MSNFHLTQALHRAGQQQSNRAATIFLDRTTTYAQLVQRVARMASALRDLRLKEGDRVGLLSQNSDRFLEFIYAVWWAGGVANPINIRWNEWEMVRAIDDCQTQVLFVDDRSVGVVPQLINRSEHLHTVIYAGDGHTPSGMLSYEQLIGESKPIADVRRRGDQLAAIFYNSGSRELTRGVMLSHANMMSSVLGGVEHLAAWDDTGLHAAPLFHLAGAMFMLALTLRAATQIIVPTFQIEETVKVILEKGITNTMLVPTMIRRLLDSPDVNKVARSALRQVTCVASPFADDLAERCKERLPSTNVVKVYGIPEMAPLISICTNDAQSPRPAGAVGRPTLTTEVRIVDDNGTEVPRGRAGELVVRGAGLMLGYWGKPIETADAVRDGWLYTGDAAHMDRSGELFVAGKLSDVVVTGGEYVVCSEVESAVMLHPSIGDCAVIGIPNDRWGQSVHAIVVVKSGNHAPSLEAIRIHCRQHISGYKCPVSLEVRDVLPRSVTGEILKSLLHSTWGKRAVKPTLLEPHEVGKQVMAVASKR